MAKYEDFDILIGPAFNGHHQVTVTKSSAGTGGGVQFPSTLLKDPGVVDSGEGGEAARGRLRETPAESGTPLLTPEQLGQALFSALFSGSVLTMFQASAGSAGRSGNRLRVRLQFDLDDPSIAHVATLPWEMLYEKEQGRFLVKSRDVTVVRNLSTRTIGEAVDLKPVTGPVRVLFAMADPAKGTEKALNLKAEQAGIEAALQRLAAKQIAVGGPRREIQPTFLEDATFEELTQRLQDEDFHIIHFMGHGDFDAEHQGQLRFCDSWRSGKDLADVLRSEKNTRLVTLNACRTAESADTPGVDPFAGVAQALVRGGIPAVVAMQFPVTDKAAIAFASCLYSELAAGNPIEAAVDAGRIAIVGMSSGTEWATPILFLREPVSFALPDAPAVSAALPATNAGPWGPDDGRFRVFMATSITNLKGIREDALAKLRASADVRFALPPEIVDDRALAAYRSAVKDLADGADLCVHLLGDTPGEAWDREALNTFPIEQLRIALEGGRPVMVIVPREARDRIQGNDAYNAYVESLEQHYARTEGASGENAHRFERAFVEDKNTIGDLVVKKVDDLKSARASQVEAGAPLRAYVDAFTVDVDYAFQLHKYLTSKSINVTLGSPMAANSFDVEIRKYPIYIVVQGGVEKSWVKGRYDAARRAAVNNPSNTLVGVYYSAGGPGGKKFAGMFSDADPPADAASLMKQLESGIE